MNVEVQCEFFFIDNMPVTWCYKTDGDKSYCSIGFPMGCFLPKNTNARETCPLNVSMVQDFQKPKTLRELMKIFFVKRAMTSSLTLTTSTIMLTS